MKITNTDEGLAQMMGCLAIPCILVIREAAIAAILIRYHTEKIYKYICLGVYGHDRDFLNDMDPTHPKHERKEQTASAAELMAKKFERQGMHAEAQGILELVEEVRRLQKEEGVSVIEADKCMKHLSGIAS